MSLALHFAKRGEGIGRFSRLRDGKQEGALVDGRITVTQLTGVFHFDR